MSGEGSFLFMSQNSVAQSSIQNALHEKALQDGAEYVSTGDVITDEANVLSGHGTLIEGGKVIATVCGFVERVNKLISVVPLNSRYTAHNGDVVVGRITEVGDKRWKVDLNTKQDAILQLSAVNLPGGAQRRRTHEDSLQMRNFFVEGDLISAEVQSIREDGGTNLHTRSNKYGKLVNGIFLSVPAVLVKRSSQHFHSLACGVDVILGNNGFIWITKSPPKDDEDNQVINSTEVKDKTKLEDISASDRQRICRVRNSIIALARMFLPIYAVTVMDVYDMSMELGILAKDVANKDNLQRVTHPAAERMTS